MRVESLPFLRRWTSSTMHVRHPDSELSSWWNNMLHTPRDQTMSMPLLPTCHPVFECSIKHRITIFLSPQSLHLYLHRPSFVSRRISRQPRFLLTIIDTVFHALSDDLTPKGIHFPNSSQSPPRDGVFCWSSSPHSPHSLQSSIPRLVTSDLQIAIMSSRGGNATHGL